MPFFIFKTRKYLTFKDEISEHFVRYKSLYCLFWCFVAAGFIVGIIAGVNKSTGNELEFMPDAITFKFLTSNLSVWQLFLSRLFSMIGMFVLVWILCLNRWSSLLCLLLILFCSFVFGATCAVLICHFRLVGFLNVIFCYFPCRLLSLFCLICFCAVSVKYSFENHLFGCSVCCRDYFSANLVCICAVILLLFLACLIEILIFPWLSAVIIIN